MYKETYSYMWPPSIHMLAYVGFMHSLLEQTVGLVVTKAFIILSSRFLHEDGIFFSVTWKTWNRTFTDNPYFYMIDG